MELVWDRAGNVVGKASVSQVDPLTLQRPAAKANVLEAQTDRVEVIRGCSHRAGVTAASRGKRGSPRHPGWRSLLFRDLTFNQATLLEESYSDLLSVNNLSFK